MAIPFLEPDGFKVNQFPVVRSNECLVPWNIHRVFLDQLPILDIAAISEAGQDSWYMGHFACHLSQRERPAYTSKDPGTEFDALVNLRLTVIGTMILAAGLDMPPQRVFSVQHNARKDADVILFVDKIRYDDAAHTVVFDAFVLVVSEEMLQHVSALLPHLRAQGIRRVRVDGREKEMAAWRRLLPVLVERCRTTWTHGPNCEYAQPDGSIRIPRELPKVQNDPLCSCGRGRDVDGMMQDGVWRMFAPYVTRIALSPLFGVSHVEKFFDPAEAMEMPPYGLQEDWQGEIQSGSATPQGVLGAPPPVCAISPAGSKPHNGDGDGDSNGPRAAMLGTVPVATCNGCRKHESGDVKLLKCARCKTALYSSAACQKGDWKTHKLQCGKN